MQRFCLYEGVPGVLVGHPSQRLGERRYLGMRGPRALKEGEKFEELHMLFEPYPEIALDGPAMQKCVKHGELKKLAGPVVARDLAEARSKFEKAGKLQAKKPAQKKADS